MTNPYKDIVESLQNINDGLTATIEAANVAIDKQQEYIEYLEGEVQLLKMLYQPKESQPHNNTSHE